jgi:outer membrane immunogenic protein
MRYVLIATIAATAFATPLFAQPAEPQSGFHVDVLGGYDHPRIDGQGADGAAYGLGAGYDASAGRAIFGVEGEVGDSTANRCTTGTVIAGDRLCVNAGRDLYVGGRVGARVGANSLIYLKAGYTNARVGVNYDDGTSATVADFSDHRDLDGVRAGAGAQLGIGSHAYVRTEYRYSNYQDGVERHQVVAGVGVRF